MNQVFKLGAIAAAVAFSGTAAADLAETKGGIKIKTEDGRFEANVGGRIQFDGYAFGDFETNGAPGANPTSGTEFRRARITLSGKAYGWEYKFEEDFAGSGANRNFCTGGTVNTSDTGAAADPVTCTNASGLTGSVTHRDMFIATTLGPGKLTIGQFKPYRSMEELTSSNEITMMERPFTSASGIFNGRQFQQGIGYLMGGESYTFGASAFSLRDDAQPRNEGLGYSARGTFTPINTEGSVVHLGLSYGGENRNRDSGNIIASAAIAGRRSVPSTELGRLAALEEGNTAGLELATVQGPFYLQAEYMQMTLGQAAGAEDQDVTAYYLMTSFHLTGESKPYKKATGVFGSAKPAGDGGAWELALRYDFAENSDLAAEPEVTTITAGLNYYVNPNVRFMLNYATGESEVIASGARVKTELDQLSARAQFAF